MKKNVVVVSVVTILLIALVVLLYVLTSGTAGEAGPDLGPFASCLKDKGILFYGAFWCPHCQAQKALFGNAVDKLPYIECSTPDGNSQTPLCAEKGIRGYPTWVFPDGARLEEVLPLRALAERSGCVLPSASSTAPSAQ